MPTVPENEQPDAQAERRKRRILIALWVLFWVLMLTVAWQDRLYDPRILWWEPLLWEGSSLSVGTLWLIAVMRSSRRTAQLLDRPLQWFVFYLKWFPVVAVLFIAAVYAIRHGVYGLLGRSYVHEPWHYVLVYESIKLWLFLALWLGIFFALESFPLWQAERRRLAEVQRLLAEAQLAQLKAQLRPHFLFNSLNTISSLMHVDVTRADRLLAQLAELLRASLRVEREELTPLAAELRLGELYARIMAERFEGRVRLTWAIDDEALGGLVPSMLLQPLIENAFKHGVEHTSVPATIAVAARRNGGQLEIEIVNSGAIVAAPGEGIGVSNTRARLKARYGDAAAFSLDVQPDRALVRIVLPWQERTS
jgi:two-component system LytT family sensor kinase